MGQIRQLGLIMESLERMGFPVTHAYDDLIFIEHLPFILQFSEKDARRMSFFGHIDVDEAMHNELFAKISVVLGEHEFKIVDQGQFNVVPNDNDSESIDVRFYPHVKDNACSE
jgi:hypothetical protein